MRRFLCFATSLSLLFLSVTFVQSGMFSSAFAAEIAETQTDGSNKSEIIAAEYLKILGAADFEQTNLNDEISRQEFAKIVSIIGGCVPENSPKEIFSDVSAESEFAKYINSLAVMNVIKSGGKFEPNRIISLEEAATMLVRILGYGYRAETNGGYPYGYMSTARLLKLFKDIDTSLSMTKGMASQICVNALDVEVMRQTVYGTNPEYATSNEYTLAYQTFGIIHVTEVVDAVDITALKGENPTVPYHISIGGVMVNIGELDPRGFLGYEVDAYYCYSKSRKEYVLKWICKTDRNKETVIDAESIKEVKNGIIRYFDENNKLKSCKFNVMAPVIYNGAATSEPFSQELLNGLYGDITVLDNGSSQDVVFADLYYNLVVGEADGQGEKVFDRFDKTKSLAMDTEADEPYTIIYNSVGEEVFLGDVYKDSVLSVYKSKSDADQEYVEIYLSNEKVVGAVEALSKLGKKTFVTISSREYELDGKCAERVSGRIKAGNTVELLLDIHGDVAAINFEETSMTFHNFIALILDDMCRENDDCEYEFKGIKIWLSR